MPKTHVCPRRGCSVQVPNTRYACAEDWRALSMDAKEAIRRTARMHVLQPERRAAFRLADQSWEDA